MNIITNATPMSYNRGIQDVSGKTLAPQPLAQPTLCPKFFLYTERGKTDQAYMVIGDSRDSIFGRNSFDPLQKWANHATMFSNAASAQATSQMIKRVVPADAPPPAALRLYIDLLDTEVQDFVRNSNGSIKYDSSGNPIPAGKIPGFSAKFVVEEIALNFDGQRPLGQASIKAGDQTNSQAGKQSQRFPIMDFSVSSQGAWGNNQGIRIWAPTTETPVQIDQRLVSDQKAYQFYLAVAARPDELTTPKIVPTLGGSQTLSFVLKPGLINRNNDSKMYLGDTFVESFNDAASTSVSPTIGAFDYIHVYDQHIKSVLDMVYATEVPHADAFSDFTNEQDEAYRFNLFGGTNSNGVPYHSYQIVTAAGNSARLTESSTHFAKGGGDGTMSDALFAALVEQELLQYADPNSPLQDSVMNPETTFWDSGFPLKTKKASASILAVRKDIAVVASVYEVGGPTLTDEQERSVAASLLSHFQMYPESDYYGTPVARAMIVGASGLPLNSQFSKRLPASYEILNKACAYMGAGNGKWKSGKAFDVSPLNQVDYMRDMSLPFRPANARFKDWDAGLVWPQSYSMTRQFFPALQTVYNDDTSVLNNFITMLACVWLERVGESVHRDFTGRSDLSQDQLVDRVNKAIIERCTDVFDNRYVIVPETTFTADDNLRGYSWTTVIKIYSPMMVTVQTLTIQSNRLSDLPA